MPSFCPYMADRRYGPLGGEPCYLAPLPCASPCRALAGTGVFQGVGRASGPGADVGPCGRVGLIPGQRGVVLPVAAARVVGAGVAGVARAGRVVRGEVVPGRVPSRIPVARFVLVA